MKPRISAFVIVLLICGLALASITHLGTVKAATNVSGVISADTTWTKTNSPYSLTGNILVSNGVTLTIEAGTTVNLNGYYIMVNGTLRARGTSSNKITFNGAGSISFTGFSADWNEQTNSGCIVENAIFRTTSVSSDSSVKISKSSLDSGVSGGGATIISENVIEGKVSGGLVSGNTITGDVSGDTVTNNIITGSVSGNTVSKNTITGGVIARGNCVISENTVTGGISGNGIGISVASEYIGVSGYPTIEDNTITNTNIGISIGVLIRDWFSANIPQIHRNAIIKNQVGMLFEIVFQNPYGGRKPTTIQYNMISQNAIGIKIRGTFEQCTIQNNNIQDNSEYNLYLDGTSNNVNATYNWWGTTNEQAISQSIYDYKQDFTLGIVSFVPFLTEPNPQAPAIPTSTPTPPPTDFPTPTPPNMGPTSPPTSEPALTPEQLEAIAGAVITVVVIGAAIGLLIYLIKKK
ncbi:hypothetical protein G4O51_08160 [Candidatus Bathyarchaeota archaeon A05DMB-2]|jgi:parallel beta-helix repeat protein|nr:hypothetical protein [Candidatus Bathyarchaeota archaeon A05DMB-2]